jgi:methyl-accepting chemotaxis protein
MKLQRRQYISHKKFQFRLVGTLMILVLIATLVTTVINHYFLLSSMVDFTMDYGRGPTGMELLVASVRPLTIILPVVFVVLAVMVVFISHRIAGPLYRLKQYMEKIENGDYSVTLKFRQNDAIHDVADSFNRMVAGIRHKFDKKDK